MTNSSSKAAPVQIVTRTLSDGSIWHIVSHSPRGFSNELGTVAFIERGNAEAFVSEVQNGAGWVVEGSQAGYRARDWTPDTILYIWDSSEQF